jgi:hypothetical protein
MLLMRSLDLEIKYRRWRSAAMSSANSLDNVNSPSHYNTGQIECIQAIEAFLNTEQLQGYLSGNCFKYLWRHTYKGKPVEDLNKCQWYLDKLIATYDPSVDDEIFRLRNKIKELEEYVHVLTKNLK